MSPESCCGSVGCLWLSLSGVYNQDVFWGCSTQLEGNTLWSPLRWLFTGLSSLLAEGWKYQLLATWPSPWGFSHHGSQFPPEYRFGEKEPKKEATIIFKTWSLNWHPIASLIFNSLEASNKTQPNLRQGIT